MQPCSNYGRSSKVCRESAPGKSSPGVMHPMHGIESSVGWQMDSSSLLVEASPQHAPLPPVQEHPQRFFIDDETLLLTLKDITTIYRHSSDSMSS